MHFYISIFGFFISILLFYYANKHNTGNFYLAGFFLLNSIYVLTNYAEFFSNDVWLAAILHGHFMGFYYLIGPFVFFYVRSVVNDNSRLTKKDLIHFIPFLILFIGIIPYTFSSFEHKTELIKSIRTDPKNLLTNINFIVPQRIHLALRPTFMLLYFCAAYRLFYKNRNTISEKILLSGMHFRHVEKWLHVFLITSVVITFVIMGISIWGIFVAQHISYFDMVTEIYHFMFSSYFIMNAALFFFPEVLYGIPRKKPVISSEKPQQIFVESKSGEVEVQLENTSNKPLLGDDYIIQLQNQIAEYLKLQPFIHKEFSLSSMSFDLKVPLHHLSYYFNISLQCSFTDWRNSLRVNFARQLMETGHATNLTLYAIAVESGFSSQATFIRAFKKSTDLTPGEYLKLQGDK